MSSALAELERRINEIELQIAAATRDDVFEYLTRHPGSRAGEIASGLGVGQGAVSAHLYRGKGGLFASSGGRWFPIPSGDPSGNR